MKRFEVLNRDLNIHRHYLLEASAGTGKTFSIENLYVRLLIEDPICHVDQILVVTFTRAATSELKERIHKNIERSLSFIISGDIENSPDFVKKILECKTQTKKVKRRLEQALADFEEAFITTIHAFCERTLKECSFIFDEETEAMNDLVQSNEIRKVIHDFFITGLNQGSYSTVQLKFVLSKYGNDIRRVENALLNLLSRGLKIVSTECFEALFKNFSERFVLIQNKYQSEKILEDFYQLAPSFKKITNRQKEINPDILQNIKYFSSLFDQEFTKNAFEKLVSEGLTYAKVLHPDNMKCKAALPENLHYPELVNFVQENLHPIINEACDPYVILGRMAHDCQKLLENYLSHEEKYQYDDLLKKMLRRSCGANFANRIRGQYNAVIIDEFQDTDPIQWGIFRQLFLKDPEKRSHLYLVGDPKQSIYAFRQADIYTYMSAAESLGEDHLYSLDTNYRSEPRLVDAMNALFAKERIPEFFHLPKLMKSISCKQVFSGKQSNQIEFHDDKGSIHFIIGEGKKSGSKWPPKPLQEELFYSTIVNEMIRMKNECNISFSQWAILVRDRYQAEDFSRYCERFSVPTRKQKQKILLKSPAFQSTKELLEALNHPKDISALKILFGGSLLRWTHHQLKQLDEEDVLLGVCEKWSHLREKALKKGFAEFIDQLLRTTWKDSGTLYESMIQYSEEFFHEFVQICDLISEFQYQQNGSLIRCQQYLNDFETMEFNDDEGLKCHQNRDAETAEILTIHMSKGLEFDIVVPLGLMNRTPKKDNFIPVQNDSEGHLVAITDPESDLYRNFQKEIDSEKMRQLYVALTRAKHRLYVPIAIEENGSGEIMEGESSPIELFLSHFNHGENFVDWIDREGHQHNISYSLATSISPAPYKFVAQEIDLKCPEKVTIPGTQQVIKSFSSLTKSLTSTSLLNPPHDFNNPDKSPHTIPSGRDIGLLIHLILETISYEKVEQSFNSKDLKALIEPFTKNSLFHEWSDVIGEIIFNTLKKPFVNGVSLSEIPSESRFHEIEFLYPNNPSDNLLKGVIDFVFECSGLYYIVDWKSNWLGSSCDDYHADNLEQAMKEHDYYFQAAIYQQALERYLKPFETRSFEECFGGTYYLFLRGMNFHNDSGVCFIDRERAQLQLCYPGS
ncbi:MAG: RecBCD enzyme subunit RecB [Chlamydiae bacterium]|nr:RecBCD enzyme subunit RecB [Chlamydiota bacterium]